MKKQFITLIALVVFVFIAVYTSVSGQEPEQWVSFKSEQFNYSIDFPVMPLEVTDVFDTEAGEMSLSVAELDCSEKEGYNNIMYMLNCTVYPDALIHSDFIDLLDLFFTNTINSAVSNTGGELLSSYDVIYEGYPGREVRIAADEGKTIFSSRLYLIGSKFFMMIILTEAGKGDNREIGRFFDSFRVGM